jgi:antitoxin component of MazEF toxin-antitoxin module
MLKKLTRHGNSLALVIDKVILDSLDIDEQTLLIISPVRDENRQKSFNEAMAKTNNKYGRTLKSLAD